MKDTAPFGAGNHDLVRSSVSDLDTGTNGVIESSVLAVDLAGNPNGEHVVSVEDCGCWCHPVLRDRPESVWGNYCQTCGHFRTAVHSTPHAEEGA